MILSLRLDFLFYSKKNYKRSKKQINWTDRDRRINEIGEKNHTDGERFAGMRKMKDEVMEARKKRGRDEIRLCVNKCKCSQFYF